MIFRQTNPTPFNQIFTAMPDDLIYLLTKFLSLDPLKRGTCTEALKHSFFSNEPYPCDDSELLLLKRSSEDLSPQQFKRRKLED